MIILENLLRHNCIDHDLLHIITSFHIYVSHPNMICQPVRGEIKQFLADNSGLLCCDLLLKQSHSLVEHLLNNHALEYIMLFLMCFSPGIICMY